MDQSLLKLARGLRSGLFYLTAAYAIGLFLVQQIAYHSTDLGVIRQMTFSKAYTDERGDLLRLTTSKDGRFRLWTGLDGFPNHLKTQLILKEDRWFYFHPGINYLSVARSAWQYFRSQSGAGGGSTLSMQLARMIWRLDTKTPAGKLKQIWLAIGLESHLSKNEILEGYLNLAPFGASIEGVGAASWIYFNKESIDLTEAEALRLVLVPQNPVHRDLSNANVLTSTHLKSLLLLTRSYCSEQHIPKLQCDQLWEQAQSIQGAASQSLLHQASHLTERLEAMIPSPTVYSSGTVKTTLNLSLQRTLREVLTQELSVLAKNKINNGAILVVHGPTMTVKSYIGSANFFDTSIQGQVDGIRAKRSPGSTLKPFIFGLALDAGIINSQSVLFDVPNSYGVYDPENYDRDFVGPISATEALTRSRNIPAIALLKEVGVNQLYDRLLNAGVSLKRDVSAYGLPMAVGGVEMSMWELVQLYSMFFQEGKVKRLHFLQSPNQANFPDKIDSQFLSPESNLIVKKMLQTQNRVDDIVMRGSQTTDQSMNKDKAAWKTGTSFGFHDAWTVGTVGEYVIGVWLGDFKGIPNNSLVGREVAAPLWFKVSDVLSSLKSIPSVKLSKKTKDLNLVRLKVCALSGDLPGPGCNQTVLVDSIPGVSPYRPCPIHGRYEVNIHTGKLKCPLDVSSLDPSQYRAESFEMWPSHVYQYLAKVGIKIGTLPPFESGCAQTSVVESGSKPEFVDLEITSPQAYLIYKRPIESLRTSDALPLDAKSLPDSGTLNWFIDDVFIGSSNPSGSHSEKTLMWDYKPGVFDVRVVDEKGRVATRRVEVSAVL
ncbi:MAG: penicillin-binding protein 1C [Proteobacteria bacterium]|nr:penicillin-binding protein 1C [Pseudomonadota bacterium]